MGREPDEPVDGPTVDPVHWPVMQRGRRWGWHVVAGAVLACCLLASAAGPAGASSGSESSTTLSRALDRLVSMPGGPPGAIALVQVGGHTQVTTAGVGNTVTDAPISPDDTVRIASVSKAFSGAVALALVTRGQLNLDDTIGQRLPYLPRSWRQVTLGQLLHHTSGLADYIRVPAFLDLLKRDPHAQLSPIQLLAYVTNKRPLFMPGSQYDYSDSDNIVVGLMVEAVTHDTYEAALARYVTGPLDLTQTSLPGNADLTEPYIHGYAVEAGTPPEDISTYLNPGLAWASGGMLSTPAELNTFMRAYIRGTLTDPHTHHEQFRFVPGSSGPPGPGTNSAGLAVYRYRTACGTVYGHTGNFPGYTLFSAATADGSRSVTVIINEQLNDNPVTPPFTQLRLAEGLGVCAATGLNP
jgi:D-alanyl-D-alanine carboxypeptidase